jgi:hypothetical protein
MKIEYVNTGDISKEHLTLLQNGSLMKNFSKAANDYFFGKCGCLYSLRVKAEGIEVCTNDIPSLTFIEYLRMSIKLDLTKKVGTKEQEQKVKKELTAKFPEEKEETCIKVRIALRVENEEGIAHYFSFLPMYEVANEPHERQEEFSQYNVRNLRERGGFAAIGRVLKKRRAKEEKRKLTEKREEELAAMHKRIEARCKVLWGNHNV